MTGRLHDKVALVTGGSRGIGRAICETFAREGAAVIVNFAANVEQADAVVAAILESGGQAFAVQADVAQKSQVAEMAVVARSRFGRIDILVNNAGILRSGNTLTMNDEELDRMFAINVKGIVHCAREVAPGMIERRYGKIVNLSSVAGLSTAAADTTPYAITKAAVISLTKRLAFELGPHNINVNALAPGIVRTDMLQFFGNESDSVRMEMFSRKAILNRIGAPEDIANAALFMASDESSYMTAQVLTVDGGRMDFLTHSS